jgi:Tol biopolymer transport system component
MLTDDARLSLADLAAAGIRLRPVEAVTIARELILQVARGEVPGVPSAHVIRLSRSGALSVEGPVAASGNAVSRGAQLLESLLPPREAGSEYKVPGALRLSIVRALGSLDVPPYPSLESFADALQRFASADREATIRELVEKWAAAATAAEARASVEQLPANEETKTSETAPEPLRLDDSRRLREHSTTALVRPRSDALTISDIRRARRATGLPLVEISTRSQIPVALLRQLEWGYLSNWPLGLNGRTQLIDYARAAGLDEQIVIATVWPMLEDVAREREHAYSDDVVEAADVSPVSMLDGETIELAGLVRTHGTLESTSYSRGRSRLRWWQTSGVMAAAALLLLLIWPAVRNTGNQPSVDPSTAPVGTSTADGTARVGSEASGPNVGEPATLDAPQDRNARGETAMAPPADPLKASADASNAINAAPTAPDNAQRARGLTGGDTTWSPAFATVGSALFYHAQKDAGSALIRADTDSEGTTLRITRVVDDDSHNFHARPSPDGTRIAFDSDRDGERGVYVAEADGTNVRRVSGEGFAAVPSWSPDGRSLAFVKAEADRPSVWNLWLLDLTTGNMRRLTAHRVGQPWGASWFPDGRRVAYSHERRIIVLDLESGRERIYPAPRKSGWVRTPAVSPDGRRIIFQLHGDGAWLLDLDDGSMRKVLADPTAEEYTWSPDGRRVAYHSRRSGEWGVWLMAPR